MIRVMIVEDIEEVRMGFCRLVRGAEEMEVVGAYESTEEAVDAYRDGTVDVALVDIKLPGKSGIELIRRLKGTDPQLEVMMLTVFEDDRRVFESIRAGATGYVLKAAGPEAILRGIRELSAGGSPMSGSVARRVVQFLQPDPDEDVKSAGITPREWEILELLAAGYLYRGISEELSISMHTVRSHVHNIYEKLHVKNRAQAVKKVRKSLTP